MLLEIISPDKKIYSGEVVSVSFPGTEGSFGILKNHAPLVSTLKEGTIKIANSENKEETFQVNGGVVQVLNNRIIVLVE
jgi:F-type H+-transporting ATPase subunit epsilon